MTINVLFFAHYQDVAGGKTLAVELDSGATVAQLAHTLRLTNPKFSEILSYARIAVNAEIVSADMVLSEGDEVAILPPMSGG
jgi:molybdopterin converting factor subunit 1